MLSAFSYPKSSRLLKRSEFLAINGKNVFKTSFDSFTVLARPNGSFESRLGITVTKKIGNAVVRNRIKRVVREMFRLNRALWPGGLDILFIARRELKGRIFSLTGSDVPALASKLARQTFGHLDS